ncbi:MAG: hypothetical protein HS118_11360 [Bacteroidia bacterium]|nr:hypothetical protein [Bacteroidia bacterium]
MLMKGAIAEEYLFRPLMEDSTLIEADSAYAAFMAEKTGEATNIYTMRKSMKALTAMIRFIQT